ncbi:hypothetical protein V6N12_006390 [Hibiscus sabdariffa]|uniref:DUF4220 domain-containing protein n=1 Tax=Hibiscus sabdariffa TaxID=183260 RepID=A0ABR2EYN9_9ROSI
MERMGSPVFGCDESFPVAASHPISIRSTKIQGKMLTLRRRDCVGHLAEGSAAVELWVPFLLWHLGSPANITAYSLEDNELWLRHFLGLVSNGAQAVYIYLKFRTAGRGSNYQFDLVMIPLLVCGILKYAERIVALRSASSEQLRNTLYSDAERSQLNFDGNEMVRTGMYEPTAEPETQTNDEYPQLRFLHESCKSFEIFRPLFLDLRSRFPTSTIRRGFS